MPKEPEVIRQQRALLQRARDVAETRQSAEKLSAAQHQLARERAQKEQTIAIDSAKSTEQQEQSRARSQQHKATNDAAQQREGVCDLVDQYLQPITTMTQMLRLDLHNGKLENMFPTIAPKPNQRMVDQSALASLIKSVDTALAIGQELSPIVKKRATIPQSRSEYFGCLGWSLVLFPAAIFINPEWTLFPFLWFFAVGYMVWYTGVRLKNMIVSGINGFSAFLYCLSILIYLSAIFLFNYQHMKSWFDYFNWRFF
jgi:hypothetical protein